MSPARVALVTPTFWPVGSPRQEVLHEFLAVLQEWSTEVVVITERHDPSWSPQFRYREALVRRVDRPLRRPWTRSRFARSIEQSLREIASEWDAILIWTWGSDFPGMVTSLRGLTRQLVACIDRPWGPQLSSAERRQIRLALATCDRRIGNCDLLLDWLGQLDSGLCDGQVVPDSVALSSHDASLRQEGAREQIAALHPLLNFERNQPVAIAVAPMDGDAGAFDLLESWRLVRKKIPRAQLVLGGQGPQSVALWNRIRDLQLQGNVWLAGWFDDWTGMLAAADLYVHADRAPRACPILLRAMGLNRPVLITESEPVVRQFPAGLAESILPVGDRIRMADSILDLLQSADRRRRMAALGRDFVQTHRTRQPLRQWFRELLSTSPLESIPAPL